MTLIKRGGSYPRTEMQHERSGSNQSTNKRPLPFDLSGLDATKSIKTENPEYSHRVKIGDSFNSEHQPTVQSIGNPFAKAARFDDGMQISDLITDAQVIERVQFWVEKLNSWSQNSGDEFAAAARALRNIWRLDADALIFTWHASATMHQGNEEGLGEELAFFKFPLKEGESKFSQWGTSFHVALENRSDSAIRQEDVDDGVPSDFFVGFYSEIDKSNHVVSFATNHGHDEVLVESNPTPLSTIIQQQMWQKVGFSTSFRKKLQDLQKDAIQRLQEFGRLRSRSAGETLRKVLENIAKELAKLKTLPETELKDSKNFGDNSGKIEGLEVVANPLSLNSKKPGHGPSKDGRLMKAIRKAAGDESKSYKQMHLLNDNVFGPGELWNLTPGPAKSNVEMEKKVETHLKLAVLDKGLVLHFKATVEYNKNANPMEATVAELEENPNKYRFQKIKFTAEHLDPATLQKANPQDSDISRIDGISVKWDWGNLTPLKPKPDILSTSDPKELVDVGFPKPHAERIVNFTVYRRTNNNPITLPRNNKKENLARLIEAHDRGSKMSTRKWPNADRVRWK